VPSSVALAVDWSGIEIAAVFENVVAAETGAASQASGTKDIPRTAQSEKTRAFRERNIDSFPTSVISA